MDADGCSLEDILVVGALIYILLSSGQPAILPLSVARPDERKRNSVLQKLLHQTTNPGLLPLRSKCVRLPDHKALPRVFIDQVWIRSYVNLSQS